VNARHDADVTCSSCTAS